MIFFILIVIFYIHSFEGYGVKISSYLKTYPIVLTNQIKKRCKKRVLYNDPANVSISDKSSDNYEDGKNDLFEYFAKRTSEEEEKLKEMKKNKKRISVTYTQKLPKKNILLKRWKYDLFEKIKEKMKKDDEMKRKTKLSKYKYKLPIDFFKLGDSIRGKIVSVKDHLIKLDISSIHLAHLYIKRYFNDKTQIHKKYKIGEYIDVVISYIHKKNNIIQVTNDDEEIKTLRTNLKRLKDAGFFEPPKREEKNDSKVADENDSKVVGENDSKVVGENDSKVVDHNEDSEIGEPKLDDQKIKETLGVEFQKNDEVNDLMYIKEGSVKKKKKNITEYKIEDIVDGVVKFVNENGAYIDIGCKTLAFLNLGHYNKDPNLFLSNGDKKKKKIEVDDYFKNLKIRKIDVLNNRIEVTPYNLQEEACLRIINQQETIKEQNKYIPSLAYMTNSYHIINYLKRYNQMKNEKKKKNNNQKSNEADNIHNLFDKRDQLDKLKQVTSLEKKNISSFILKYNELSSPNSNYQDILEQNADNQEFIKEITMGQDQQNRSENNQVFDLQFFKNQNKKLKNEIENYRENETQTDASSNYQNDQPPNMLDPMFTKYGITKEISKHGENPTSPNIPNIPNMHNIDDDYDNFNDLFHLKKKNNNNGDYENLEQDGNKPALLYLKKNIAKIKKSVLEETNQNHQKIDRTSVSSQNEYDDLDPENFDDNEDQIGSPDFEQPQENADDVEDDESFLRKENQNNLLENEDDKSENEQDEPFFDVKKNLDYILSQNINMKINQRDNNEDITNHRLGNYNDKYYDNTEKYIEEASKLFGDDIKTWDEKMYYYFGSRDNISLDNLNIYDDDEFKNNLLNKKEDQFDKYNEILDSNHWNVSNEKDFISAVYADTQNQISDSIQTNNDNTDHIDQSDSSLYESINHSIDSNDDDNNYEHLKQMQNDSTSNILKNEQINQFNNLEEYINTFTNDEQTQENINTNNSETNSDPLHELSKQEIKNENKNLRSQNMNPPELKTIHHHSGKSNHNFDNKKSDDTEKHHEINIDQIVSKALHIGNLLKKNEIKKLKKAEELKKINELKDEEYTAYPTDDSNDHFQNPILKINKNFKHKNIMEPENELLTESPVQLNINEPDSKQFKDGYEKNINKDDEELKAYKNASYEVQGYYKRKIKSAMELDDMDKETDAEADAEPDTETEPDAEIDFYDDDIINEPREKTNNKESFETNNHQANINSILNVDSKKDMLHLYGEYDPITQGDYLEKILQTEKNTNKAASKDIELIIQSYRHANECPDKFIEKMNKEKEVENDKKHKIKTEHNYSDEFQIENNSNELPTNSYDKPKNINPIDKIKNNMQDEFNFLTDTSVSLKMLSLKLGLLKETDLHMSDQELINYFINNKRFRRVLKFYNVNIKNVTIPLIYKITKLLYFERPFPKKEKNHKLSID
ncbi:conserved Plasmodium protein, unknown function [Plasmodium chabaudi adami]|uniref:S1 motif domain-containing protein n=1 Tax=Plasmodium chabaudi adami TaxID=5826 RepID=A0A1C6YDM9_PLACE|nr:conserved Plasmodium protein, unknown function [Plasmodium chabaudi adami]